VARVTSSFDLTNLSGGFGDETIDRDGENQDESKSLWYVSGHLGGTNLLLDDSGQMASEVIYYPYGLTRYTMNEKPIRYRFTGKELDASDLYYYGARFYDPVATSFLSVDPLWLHTSQRGVARPEYLHSYAYANNNPQRYVDPDGRVATAVVIIAGGIIVWLASDASTAADPGFAPNRPSDLEKDLDMILTGASVVGFGGSKVAGAAAREGWKHLGKETGGHAVFEVASSAGPEGSAAATAVGLVKGKLDIAKAAQKGDEILFTAANQAVSNASRIRGTVEAYESETGIDSSSPEMSVSASKPASTETEGTGMCGPVSSGICGTPVSLPVGESPNVRPGSGGVCTADGTCESVE